MSYWFFPFLKVELHWFATKLTNGNAPKMKFSYWVFQVDIKNQQITLDLLFCTKGICSNKYLIFWFVVNQRKMFFFSGWNFFASLIFWNSNFLWIMNWSLVRKSLNWKNILLIFKSFLTHNYQSIDLQCKSLH